MNEFLAVPLDVEPWFLQIVKLIVLKSDKDAQTIFLYTYDRYATSEDLFLAAEDLYLHTGFDKAKHAKLASFLYYWLSRQHLDQKLKRKVLDLAKLYVPPDNDSSITKVAKRFRLSVAASYQLFRDTVVLPASPLSCPTSPPTSLSLSVCSSPSTSPSSSPVVTPRSDYRGSFSLSKPLDCHKADIFKFSCSAIAKQMTLIDHEVVSSLRISDLKNKIFGEEGGWESVTACSARFNKMSFWVATQIVIAPSTKARVDMIEKFITISAKLYKYRNFFGLYQILSGMHNANVRRLRSCWKNVSQRSINILHRLEHIMSHSNNYAPYRAHIKECQAKRVAAVPIICLLLQDLTFINDGNEDMSSDGKVNLEKWTLFGSCILAFSKLMEARYNFRKNVTIKRMLLTDLLVLPETLLMKHSYAVEARKRYPSHGNSF